MNFQKMKYLKLIITNTNGKQMLKRFYSKSIETVLVEKLGPVTTIGLNRPEKRNCLDIEMLQKLSEAINSFENDTSSVIAVLHGIGGNFCAGYDLNEVAESKESAHAFLNKITSINITNRFVKKPLIAAISGYAVGSGMELALMCDLRVMEDTAQMGLLNRRFGIPTIDGGIARLQVIVGYSCASDLLLTGRGMGGKEALERGLTTRLVACGTGLGQSINLASSVIKYPQSCLNSDRKALHNCTFEALFNAAKIENEAVNDSNILDEAVIGARKFLSGIGKHGKFYNIQEQVKKDWEIEN